MRIVSGKHKSKRITAPRNLPVRPTTDMAKEALFNILNNKFYLDEISVLDLFSGIGSISLEFVSRGCKDVIAVDKHAGCIRFLQSTSDSLEADITCIKGDGFKYLQDARKKFDFIFADPPYDLDQNQFESIIQIVFERELLNEHGLLVIEHRPKMILSDHISFQETRKYGSSAFSFFSNSANS